MNIQMNSAASSMRELQKKIDTIANNIANVNTTGYKRQEANFADALVQSFEKQAGPLETGRRTPNGIRVGAGANVSQIALRTNQGSAIQTGRELDFMITGETGFFRVESEGNTYYTKNGSFNLVPNAAGNQLNLITANGEGVLGANNQPISIDSDYDKITVNENGTLDVTYKTAGKPADAFQLSIAEITRPDLLQKTGGNLYELPGTEAEQVANGTLQVLNLANGNDGSIRVGQGSLEMSNVNLTDEMTELIATQRLLQSQSRAISFADDMRGLVNTIRG
ncbi:flagellar hook-basal body protein [Planococcus sp. CAU13]|uniref:flagellar hook-basal body protein n=1 Tax=Planococcus sp. CAU13 TaxID=1541197 RepID=UPI00052FED96|nr:flagellar hook-basal body protein [Planococcus sp. CAU13]